MRGRGREREESEIKRQESIFNRMTFEIRIKDSFGKTPYTVIRKNKHTFKKNP